jgi:hypothetical protein
MMDIHSNTCENDKQMRKVAKLKYRKDDEETLSAGHTDADDGKACWSRSQQRTKRNVTCSHTNAEQKRNKKTRHDKLTPDLTEREKQESLIRIDTMRSIPDAVRQDFGKFGFAKWGKNYLPIRQMNPFEIPPGRARDAWMKMFNNVSC